MSDDSAYMKFPPPGSGRRRVVFLANSVGGGTSCDCWPPCSFRVWLVVERSLLVGALVPVDATTTWSVRRNR